VQTTMRKITKTKLKGKQMGIYLELYHILKNEIFFLKNQDAKETPLMPKIEIVQQKYVDILA
jgi:hypothetical protein